MAYALVQNEHFIIIDYFYFCILHFVGQYFLFKIIQFPILHTDVYQQNDIFLSDRHCSVIIKYQPFYNSFNAVKYISKNKLNL